MSLFGCNCRCNCTFAAIVAAIIIGVITAFLQITGVITVTAAFLWVVLGIAVVYLAVLLVSFALARREGTVCLCASLNAALAGILGSALFAVVLLGVGIVATSVVSAILVGLLLFFLSLTLASAACLARELTDCTC